MPSFNHAAADLPAGALDRPGLSIAKRGLKRRSQNANTGLDGQNLIPACVDDSKDSGPNTRD
ncbi:MAG: hypothetical protein OXN89_15490 [Bryobacterales bacterium]|nr:hypothetical protein [Bryobacterales bacterium]